MQISTPPPPPASAAQGVELSKPNTRSFFPKCGSRLRTVVSGDGSAGFPEAVTLPAHGAGTRSLGSGCGPPGAKRVPRPHWQRDERPSLTRAPPHPLMLASWVPVGCCSSGVEWSGGGAGPGARTWDQADTSHCSPLGGRQRPRRQASCALGLGSALQRASGSGRARAAGLVPLQATDRFLQPVPQVREHCPGRERRSAPSRDRVDLPGGGGPRAQAVPGRVRTPLCAPQGRAAAPYHPPPPPELPEPRAPRSRRAGSSGAGRPGGQRGQAAGTGAPGPALICSGPAACTGPRGSACRPRTSGCSCSSSPRTSWEGTEGLQ